VTTEPKPAPGTATECRSCKAPIVWTRTAKGKSMPCDLQPSDAGTFYLFRRPDVIEAVYSASTDPRVEKAKARGDKRYVSHFSSCPQAAQHRGKSR
jgi:hypothetical protein